MGKCHILKVNQKKNMKLIWIAIGEAGAGGDKFRFSFIFYKTFTIEIIVSKTVYKPFHCVL
jgi:hypothetical protein